MVQGADFMAAFVTVQARRGNVRRGRSADMELSNWLGGSPACDARAGYPGRVTSSRLRM
ncbi:hypothetical protein HDC35_002638 [Sphingopyxis sp. JAI128]|nr:hypothetical protein [Sphingopyxis sp. JAI128]